MARKSALSIMFSEESWALRACSYKRECDKAKFCSDRRRRSEESSRKLFFRCSRSTFLRRSASSNQSRPGRLSAQEGRVRARACTDRCRSRASADCLFLSRAWNSLSPSLCPLPLLGLLHISVPLSPSLSRSLPQIIHTTHNQLTHLPRRH
jgi:hypothetical protein